MIHAIESPLLTFSNNGTLNVILSYAASSPTYAKESHIIISADKFGEGLVAVLSQMGLIHKNVCAVPIKARGMKVDELLKWLNDNNP